MPLKDFEQLRAKAKPVTAPAIEAPAAWVLERVDLAMTVRGESVHTEQTLRLVLWSEDRQEIPIRLVGTPLEVEWGELEGQLEVAGPAQSALLKVRGQGLYQVVIRSVASLEAQEAAARPTWTWRFKSPSATVISGFVQLEDSDQEVAFANNSQVAPSQGLLAPSRTQGRYRLTLVRDRQVELRLLGPRSSPDLAGLPLRLSHELVSILEVSRTRVALKASVRLRIHQGHLDSVSFEVPEGFEVTSVVGRHQGWDVQGKTLSVFFADGQTSESALEVTMIGPSRSRIDDPILRPNQGEVELHLVVAKARGDGLLELENGQVLRAAGADEMTRLSAETRATGRALALKNMNEGPSWTVVWADSARVLSAQVDRLLVDVLVGRSGKAAYQIWAEVRNRGSRLLRIQPPKGFQWVSASRDGSPLVPGSAPQGGMADGSLVIAVDSGDHSRTIHLVGSIDLPLPTRNGLLNLPLPEFSAPVARVETRISLPPGLSYRLREPSRRGEVTAPPQRGLDRQALLQSNQMAGQLAHYVPEVVINDGEMWLKPSGFKEIQAVWSALSPAPRPLQVEVQVDKEGASWF